MIRHFKLLSTNGQTESGFVLVLALVVLLLLSLLGAWAVNTSTFEMDVAGDLQQVEQQFNVSEGGANAEAGKVGFSLQPFYQMTNLSPNRLLTPTTDATFDPGNDTATTLAGITAGNPATWPWENLLQNYNNLPVNTNEFDYRYLVTFLSSATAPMGNGAGSCKAYEFRIQGGFAGAPSVVELGGKKIAPNS